jgi:hypothetical protein
MADVVYLNAGEVMPDPGDDAPWLTVEVASDGLFYGTGASTRPTGEGVYYRSLPEDDVSLDAALKAAQVWAARFNVPTIWVQLNLD